MLADPDGPSFNPQPSTFNSVEHLPLAGRQPRARVRPLRREPALVPGRRRGGHDRRLVLRPAARRRGRAALPGPVRRLPDARGRALAALLPGARAARRLQQGPLGAVHRPGRPGLRALGRRRPRHDDRGRDRRRAGVPAGGHRTAPASAPSATGRPTGATSTRTSTWRPAGGCRSSTSASTTAGRSRSRPPATCRPRSPTARAATASPASRSTATTSRRSAPSSPRRSRARAGATARRWSRRAPGARAATGPATRPPTATTWPPAPTTRSRRWPRA